MGYRGSPPKSVWPVTSHHCSTSRDCNIARLCPRAGCTGEEERNITLKHHSGNSVLLTQAFCGCSAGSSCQRAEGNHSIAENQASCLSPQIWEKNIQEQLHNVLLPRRNRKRLFFLNLCRETKFQGKSTDNNLL